MPTFETVTGKDVWFPAQAVLRVEPAEGGLSSNVHTFPPPGSPPGSTLTVEVKGRVSVIGAQLDAILNPPTTQPSALVA